MFLSQVTVLLIQLLTDIPELVYLRGEFIAAIFQQLVVFLRMLSLFWIWIKLIQLDQNTIENRSGQQQPACLIKFSTKMNLVTNLLLKCNLYG